MLATAGVVVGVTVTAFVKDRPRRTSWPRKPSGSSFACAKARSARRQSTIKKRIGAGIGLS
jgi:hypothetical protein